MLMPLRLCQSPLLCLLDAMPFSSLADTFLDAIYIYLCYHAIRGGQPHTPPALPPARFIILAQRAISPAEIISPTLLSHTGLPLSGRRWGRAAPAPEMPFSRYYCHMPLGRHALSLILDIDRWLAGYAHTSSASQAFPPSSSRDAHICIDAFSRHMICYMSLDIAASCLLAVQKAFRRAM